MSPAEEKHLRRQLCASVVTWWYRLGKVYPDIGDVPYVTLNRRFRSTAGRANVRTRVVEFNPALAATNLEDFLNTTVPHELAHIVDYLVFGRCSGHGPNWKSVMRSIGVNPARCHSYEVPESKGSVLTYCRCKRRMLGRVRAKRIRAGVVYTCNRCRAPLRVVED